MDDELPPEPASDAAKSSAHPCGLVLVTDKSEDIRWSLREVLKARGGVAIMAESVWASRVALNQYRFTAIVSGMTLSDGSGFEILAAAKAVAPAVPVFLMSGLPYDVDTLRKLGAADFFLKPFNVPEAIDAILSHRPHRYPVVRR